MTTTPGSGAVTGGPRAWLRVEGLAALIVSVVLYGRSDASWLTFALLFLVPDLSFLAYRAGAAAGAMAYNVLHSFAGPLVLGVGSLLAGLPPSIALIWAAHIGFDRALGFGLKYPTGFSDTHLGRIGRSRRSPPPGTETAARG